MTGTVADLQQLLERLLSAHFGRPCTVTALRREPYIYSTSFALEDVEVELAHGALLRLIVKDLGATGLLQGARVSKPAFLYEPRREIQTYQQLLNRAELGTATCYGAVADEPSARYALVLEKVDAVELYQVGDVGVWVEAAVWLAGMHHSEALSVEVVREQNPHLIAYDGAYYRRWLDRARRFSQDAGRVDEQPALTAVGQGLERALAVLAGSHHSFLHGEFYASNVLVGQGPAGRRVCPVDWEMAGVGPALLDLAALCTGWDEEDARAIANGYRLTFDDAAAWRGDEKEFLMMLRACQLCLAVQWLGWAPHWTAPQEHARDWLVEATRLTEELRG